MSDSPERPRLWPPSPYQLADAERCPSCFTPVSPPVCGNCGLLLDDPRVYRVTELGGDILMLELKRQEILDAIRLTQLRAAAAVSAGRPADLVTVAPSAVEERDAGIPASLATLTTEPEPAAVSALVVAPAPVAETPPPPAAQSSPRRDAGEPPSAASVPAAPPRAPRRRLSVPILLLIVGVTLVGVAAIFFLVYAWFVWGILVRALIIGGITLASMVTASFLRRRSLTATAEGIAALGVLLLALDAWALRANDFFGTGDSDPAVYAGVSALAVGAICRVWARVSRPRGPDLAAALALPAGAGLLVGGMLSLPPAESIVAGLLGASAGGLLHALPAPWSSARSGRDGMPERIVLASIGVASLTAAFACAAVLTTGTAVVVWSTAGVALLGAAHALLLTPRGQAEPLPGARVLGGIASSVAVASIAVVAAQLAYRTGEPVYDVLVAPVIAVAVAVAVDVLRHRRGGLVPAWITSGVIAGFTVPAAIVVWLAQGGRTISSEWMLWHTEPLALPVSDTAVPFLALPAAAAISVLLFFAPTLARPVLRDVRVVGAALLVLAAAVRTAVPGLVVGAGVLVAAAAVLALLRARSRAGWVASAGIGATTAYAAGLATPWLWLVGIATALAVPIALLLILRPTGARSVALVLTPVGVASVSAFIAPGALAAATGAMGAEWLVTVALLQWIGLAAVGLAVLLPITVAARTALAVSSYTVVAMTLVWIYGDATIRHLVSAVGMPFLVDGSDAAGTLRGVIGDPVLAIVRGAALVGAFAIVAFGRTPLRGRTVYAAAALVAPTLGYTIHEVLGILGARDLDAVPIIPLAGAVAVAGVGAWAGLAMEDTAELRATRVAADAGAVATALVVIWPLGAEHVWQAWGLVAIGFTALAASTGWAAPATTPEDDVLATRAPGVPLRSAWRRLLLWPAVIALVLSWVSLLGDGTPQAVFTVEVEAVPVGVVFVAFAALLVWLRRRGEAAIALALGLASALWLPAIEGWTGTPLRGTLVAVAAALVALALALPPVRSIRPTAVVGATAAVVGLGLGTVERALDEAPLGALWLVLLVAVAYASGLGMTLARPENEWSRAYALVVPPAALVAAVLGLLSSSDEPVAVMVALGVLGLLHLGAAAAHRLPLTDVTRWTAFAGALVVAGAGIWQGGVEEIEAVSLPAAGMVLAGVVLATLRRRRDGDPWPGGESYAWLGGLVLATAPSIVAPAEPIRVWAVIATTLVAAGAASVSRVPEAWRVRVPSVLVLALAAVAMGVRALADPAFASAVAAATTAACGAGAVAVLLVATSREERPAWPPTVLAAVGAALLVFVVLDRSGGGLGTTAVTAVLGGAIGVVGAALLGIRRWSGVAGVLSIAGLVVAASACGVRFVSLLGQPGLEADFWALVGGAIAVAVILTAVRAVPARWMGSAAGVVLGLAAIAFALAECLVMQAQSALGVADADQDVRTVLTMALLTAAAVAGAVWRSRFDWTLFVVAAGASAVFGLVAILRFGVSPVELVTVPPALGGLAYGSVRLARSASTRTWPALGPWIALLTIPSLLHDFGESDLWRVVALGVVGVGLVVVGAVFRLQAPLVLGSIVVIVHGIAQLWPWLSAAYIAVPWWLWLGIGGALLIFLAATYERRMRQMRSAVVAVTSLR
ncbi:hypothetical protein ABZ477_15835 [Microbacterium sp. NPDC019599]|uniref:SCO7613 C-terminal domain-containing membrane protein n=1 Tax=Microbacterium sp. NPDC019599 TaxID=3154690 RepID=UPI0033CEB993